MIYDDDQDYLLVSGFLNHIMELDKVSRQVGMSVSEQNATNILFKMPDQMKIIEKSIADHYLKKVRKLIPWMRSKNTFSYAQTT